MKKVLVINASSKAKNAFSSYLGDYFINCLDSKTKLEQIVYRELGQHEVPHITQEWLHADRKPLGEKTAFDQNILTYSDTCIQELHEAAIIVLTSPMYNWSIPSVLKSYIDQVMRVNEVFRINPKGGKDRYEGLLRNKKLVLVLSRGSSDYGPGERNEFMNFQDTYLKFVFGIMGIQHCYEVVIDGTSSADDDVLKKKMIIAKSQIYELVNDQFDEE